MTKYPTTPRFYNTSLENPVLLSDGVHLEYDDGFVLKYIFNHPTAKERDAFKNQRYAGKGYVQPETVLRSSTHCRRHTRWTQKGCAFIYNFLKEDGILPLSERPDVPADMEDFWLP